MSGCCDQDTGSPAGLFADCCADWDLELGRYFFIDPVAGSDANIGYIDAPLGTVFTPAQVAAVAKRTFAGFRAILPPSGNNRIGILLMLPGNYDAIDFRGVSGYKNLLRRGSDGTNSNGTVASVNDRVRCGYVTALAGPNPDGSFTVAAGSTVDVINIAAGSFGAADAINGFRIRFTGDVTAALTNVCRVVYSTTGGTSLVPETGTGTVPAVGNTFFIERPGVVTTDYYPPDSIVAMSRVNSVSVLGDWPIVGIRHNSANDSSLVMGTHGKAERMVGIDQSTPSASGNSVILGLENGSITSAENYVDETGTTRAVGGTLRVTDKITINGGWNVNVQSFYDFSAKTSQSSISTTRGLICPTGGYSVGGLILNSLNGGNMSNESNGAKVLGTSGASTRVFRIVGRASGANGGLVINRGSWAIQKTDIINAGAQPGIRIAGPCQVSLTQVTGTTGNTATGVDMNSAIGATLACNGSLNTLSGTAGDILAGGSAVVRYVDLALTNVVDNLNNNIYGSAGTIVTTCTLVTNGDPGVIAVGESCNSTGASGVVTKSSAAAVGFAYSMGIAVTQMGVGLPGYIATAGAPTMLFREAAAIGGIAYLTVAPGGLLTTQIPPVFGTEQKNRMGRVIRQVTGLYYRTTFQPESLSVLADGAA